MRLKKMFINLLSFCVFLTFIGDILAEEPDLKILKSSQDECLFVFSPHRFSLNPKWVKETFYKNPDFHLSSTAGNPGDPAIPGRTLILGIPLKGNIRISLISSEIQEEMEVRLLPIPELVMDETIAREVYRESAGYQQSDYLPQNLYSVEEPEFFGEQRIVRIHVFPVQYNPAEGKLKIHSQMIFQIRFENGRSPVKRHSPGNESLYRKILVNYETARQWRVERIPAKKKSRKVFLAEKRYKIPVTQEGIYKVTGSFLQSQGVDISSIDPETIKIYNNGGRELPRNLSATRSDSLIENPILTVGTQDNQFDDADYFLFYGKDVKDWEYNSGQGNYNHYLNVYTDKNIYWLVFNDGIQGKRIQNEGSLSHSNAETLETFTDRLFLEQDIHNLYEGGIRWYGQEFSFAQTSKSFQITLTDAFPDSTLNFRFKIKGATTGIHRLNIFWDGSMLTSVSVYGSSESTFSASLSGESQAGTHTLSFQYTVPSVGASAYLDWYELNYPRELKSAQGRLRIFSPTGAGKYDFQLSGFASEPVILNVTDPTAVTQLSPRQLSQAWTFTDSVAQNSPERYMAVESAGFLSLQSLTEDTPSGLRNPYNGADFVIITHRDFLEDAQRLKSLRETHDSLSVMLVDIEDVFDEFGWGLYDPTAIRDFMKFAFDSWTAPPAYLLLFGDGDYDYRNLLSNTDKNWIPPYEVDGTSHITARATDDWYTYVHGNDNIMDLAVGRIPVQTPEQARIAADKIIEYETQNNFGDWHRLMTIVGDDEKGEHGDEDETVHLNDSEYIAENIIPDNFNFKKIYLTEYPEDYSSGRRRKPLATEDLFKQINRGTIYINFLGHGWEKGWTHEWIFHRDLHMNLFDNPGKLPFFYAATCSFGFYDKVSEQSITEELLVLEDKGAVGVISATRECTASANAALNRAFLNNLLQDVGPAERLGDALRLGKLNTSLSVSNNEMYHLFGDPAMRLAVPRYPAKITSLNPDTLKALSVTTVDGQAEKDSLLWSTFDGQVSIQCFDVKKEKVYTTAHGTQIYYSLPGNSLFRGSATLDNGTFQIQFVVPKDLSYGGNTARISCYYQGDAGDGAGYMNDIPVGGSVVLNDLQGPEITLYFTGRETFISGDMVPIDPELVAEIRDDKSGINITGEIGHKIMLTLDTENPVDITDYFNYNEGSYLQGSLIYPLSGIGEGVHHLSLKAWDNANNSNLLSVDFKVIPDGELRLEEVLNYPNPMSSSTHFTFQINEDAEVEIKIFTVSGRLIKQFDGIWGTPGFNMIPWDGFDEQGDPLANGVYLYKITAKTRIGGKEKKADEIGRLIVMR